MQEIHDMPKLESPFEREMVDGKYICIPKIKDEYRWVFSDKSMAVDKLDGTNISAVIQDGRIMRVMNRENLIAPWSKDVRFAVGIGNAQERGYFKPSKLMDGQYFGELIGDKIQGNPYKLEDWVWVPFSHLINNYSFRFWPTFVAELNCGNDEEVFRAISELFKGLWSVYKRSIWAVKDLPPIDEGTKFEGLAAEGIVFYHKDTNAMCKLRRDMFSWFSGARHGKE